MEFKAVNVEGQGQPLSEYLLKMKEEGYLNTSFGAIDVKLGYHTPCHLRVQKEAKNASLDLIQLLPNVEVTPIDQGCGGIYGSWGYKKENYETSMKIGEELFKEVEILDGGITDCPTCTLQMEHGIGKDTLHPIEIITKSYENVTD